MNSSTILSFSQWVTVQTSIEIFSMCCYLPVKVKHLIQLMFSVFDGITTTWKKPPVPQLLGWWDILVDME